MAKLCLQQEVLSPGFMRDVLAAIQPGDVHVTSSCSANFCVGVSSGGEIDIEFLAGWPGVWFFCEQLRQQCDLPLIVVRHGATRGGGMFFPLAATRLLAYQRYAEECCLALYPPTPSRASRSSNIRGWH